MPLESETTTETQAGDVDETESQSRLRNSQYFHYFVANVWDLLRFFLAAFEFSVASLLANYLIHIGGNSIVLFVVCVSVAIAIAVAPLLVPH